MASDPEVSNPAAGDRWERVHQLLQAALERKPEEVSGFLRERCEGDESLLREVKSLLSAHHEAGSFLEDEAAVVASVLSTRRPAGSLAGREVGPYELLSLLGAGGMGEVYRARDSRLTRFVAIKFLSLESTFDEKRLQYFEREARLTSSLNHPNIVTIYDIGRSEFGPFIAMELIEGLTLREVLSSGGLTLKRILQIGSQIADGLARAHAAGVFHRDLKPENVMVAKDGLVKILDFGLAKLAQSDDSGLSQEQLPYESRPGTILGTVGYMSPEQASGLPVDLRTDQFSLGVILYEMLAGKPPFERATAVETLSAIIRDEPEPIESLSPDTPPPCLWIVERCLAKNPAERYASTSDLASDLGNLRDRLAGLSTNSATKRVHSRSRQTQIATIASIAGIVILASVLGLLRVQPPPVTVQALNFGNGHPLAARFTRDDLGVVYGSSWVGQDRELYTTQPGNPESRPLGLKNAGVLAVSPSGELAISYPCRRLHWGDCLGTLALVPLGSGAPRPVLENVISADWMPDAKTLVVAQFDGGRVRIVQLPGEEVLYESTGWISDIRASPDGQHIAFVDHPILGDISGAVCLLETDKRCRVLSSDWKLVHGLAWRPNSTDIWFTAAKDGRGLAARLFSVSIAGGEAQPIYSSPSGLWIDDISDDGRRVLMRRVVPRSSMIGLQPGATEERNLSLFDFSTVADLSSDGKTLLFYEWGAAVKGNHIAYLRGMNGSDAKILGEGKPLALSPTQEWALARTQTVPPEFVLLPTGTGQPKTLPRGAINEFTDWAAWLDSDRIIFSASEPGYRPRTYVQDINGGLPTPITGEGNAGVLLSADARHVVVVDRYRQYSIYPLDGGDPRPLEGKLEDDVLLQWANDGALFLHDSDDRKLSIFKLNVETGERVLWKQFLPPYPVGLVGIGHNPGEIRVTPDGQSYAYTFWTGVGELYMLEGLR